MYLPSGSRWIAVLLLLAVAGMGSWMYRVSLLQGAARAWTVSDPVGPADAVVVLGGGIETRPFAAAAYYHQGLVSKVLVSAGQESQSEMLGITPSHVALNRAVLIKLDVPESAIEILGYGLSNTFEESVALHKWAERNRASRIIVPTEVFSSRRVKWIMEQTFAGTGIQVRVPALESRDYSRDQWWRKEKGLLIFQNELIKYIYYRLRYGII